MAPAKLTDADKKDILTRYRQPEETTSTLASRYGVSTSTISRILKQNLSDDEYESLVQQKRSGGFKNQLTLDSLTEEVASTPPIEESLSPVVISADVEEQVDVEEQQPEDPASSPERRRRRRSTAPPAPVKAVEPELQSSLPEPSVSIEAEPPEPEPIELPSQNISTEPYVPQATVFEEMLDEEMLGDEEDFDGMDDDDDDDDLDDEFDELEPLDDDAVATAGNYASVHIQNGGSVQVLPLAEAQIPRICYIVVDRASELITRPLKDFADLGQIPAEETQERTLPIFDNHRVAKRFLRRMQRIVKVPDGKMLQKAGPYLQAKGITRLLIDGQVYSL